jgi:hypothetical protein
MKKSGTRIDRPRGREERDFICDRKLLESLANSCPKKVIRQLRKGGVV